MVYEAKIIDILSDSCPTHIILTGQVLRILDQDSFILGDDSGSVHVDHMDFYHESKSYIVAKKYVKLVNPKVVKGPGPALYLDEETKLFPFKPFAGCRGEPIFQLSNVAQLNPCQVCSSNFVISTFSMQKVTTYYPSVVYQLIKIILFSFM